MVNMAVPYRGPDGMSLQLQAEIRERFGSREQNKGFVTGYPEAARRGETGGHFPDKYGITHAYDIGVDIELDGSGLRTQDAMWLAHRLRALGKAGKHPFSKEGYFIHDMSETSTPRPLICGAFNNWTWQEYKGASPHSDHIHVTTGGDQQWGEAPKLAPAQYNSRISWGIATGTADTGWAMRPVPEMYPTTQTYKQNSTQYNLGAYHGALDYGVPVGTPVLAPEDGIIRHAGFAWDLPGGPDDWTLRDYQIKPARGDLRTGGGIMVRLDNAIGSRWWSAHLNRTDLNAGDRVRKGQIIGYSGNTGSSTGPHLHLALLPPSPNWNNGAWGGIDPAPYIREKYSPLTYTSWQGSPTTGVGATTTKKDWFDMADEKTLIAAIRKVIPEIRDAVLDEPIKLRGNDPDGNPYKGYTSLRHEASWGTFRGFRDRRIEADAALIPDIYEAVRPSTLLAVIHSNTPTEQES